MNVGYVPPVLRHVVQPVVVAGPLVPPGTLPVGANLLVRCRRGGQLAYIGLNPANLLYVLRNTTVEFKVEARNAAPNLLQMVNLETSAWAGTADRASAGGSKSVTFNTLSAANNAGGAYTVTVAFGGQNVAISCVVYDLTLTKAIADDFGGRSQTALGVDERVALAFTTTPAGVTALEAGGLQWKTVGAPSRDTVGLLHAPGNTALAVTQDGTAGYIAPCRTHPALQPDVSTKDVTLKLEVMSGPSIGLARELPFIIHKPHAHMRVGAGNRRHVNGQPSAGFKGEIFFTPRNVSFQTLRWREGIGALEVSGPFPAGWQGLAHGATVHQSAAHGTVTAGNSVNGCNVVQLDDVYSGAFPYVVPPRASDITPVGVQRWPIDWEYTYANLATGAWANDWIKMQKAYHKATIFESGRMVMFKGHIGCATGDCMREGDISKDIGDASVA